jgi:putative endonuclease
VSLLGKLLGRSGEDRAAKHLASRGYTILERNYTAPQGELDLIALDGDTLVFVEVKTRTSSAYGAP